MTYQIFVRNTHIGKTMAFDVKEDNTLLDIKKMINGRNKSPIEKQRLIFSGKEITDNDNKKISDLGIKKETTLQLLYKRPMMPKPPKDFFGDSLNDFILERINYGIPNNKSVVVIGGCGEPNRGGREHLVNENSLFANQHDLFRQQLPLRLIVDNYNNNKDTNIFIIDPGFKRSENSPILPEIDVVLHDISRIINPPYVKIYVTNANNIFRKIMLNVDVERENILVNVFAIPYSYSEEDKMRLVDTLHSTGHEYAVYLKNVPHQELRPDSFVSNSPYASRLIQWHVSDIVPMTGGRSKKSKRKKGKLPKHYTSGLSRKDKKKQQRYLRRSSRNYKKGEYTSRPKLKSFKNKKSNWTQKFEKKYGKDVKTYKQISKATGIPVPALKAVVKKGMGAYYSSGSRPNQTAESWGKARMYSYIMGGPTRKVDHHITEKYNVKFKV
tara:strand:+ start:766 stop:2085 length:1320 start_codon:yes stop_codon:yes gene_type:complete